MSPVSDSKPQNAVFSRKLSYASKAFGLRITSKFLHPRLDAFNARLRASRTTPLASLCAKPIRRGVQPDYDETGEVLVVKTMQLKNGHLELSEAEKVSADFAESNKRAGIKIGDILISSTGEGRGKIDVFSAEEKAIADSHVSIVSLVNPDDAVWIAALLRTEYGNLQLRQLEMSVKGTPELYTEQLARLEIPNLQASARVELTGAIQSVERHITANRQAIRPDAEVIDEILCAEFSYPLDEYKERAHQAQYRATLSSISSGFRLRSSAKYHHPHFELTRNFFLRNNHARVKAFISVPIKLGATVKKTDFIDDGDAYYVHPGATKSQGVIELEDCYQVSQEFYDDTVRRFGLRSGDVLINRSGEAAGKVAIFESDAQAVCSDFTMRLRFDDKLMDSRFAWYFFRSVMFQTQTEREIRGSSVRNIFPPEVERMLVVDCDRDRQHEIAKAITKELSKLAAHREAIETKRQQAVALIEAAISAAPV